MTIPRFFVLISLLGATLLILLPKSDKSSPAKLQLREPETRSSSAIRASKTVRAREVSNIGRSRINGDGTWYGCLDRGKFDELDLYAHDQDRAAFIGTLGRADMAGECTMFRAGEEVFLSERALLAGLVRVRRPGDTVSWWAYADAIR